MENNCIKLNILDVVRIKREKIKMSIGNKNSYYILSCRINGESLFFYNGETHKVKVGDILYIPEGAGYVQQTNGEELIAIHLEAYDRMPDKIHICRSANPDVVCSLFKHTAKLWNEKPSKYLFGCMSDIYKLLEMCDLDFDGEKLPDVIAQSVEYMKIHMYDVDFCVEEAYQRSFVSRTYFNKVFRKFYGTTPTDYINNERISKAKILLKSKMYTREETATLCGVSNVKYFYVLFKKYTGMTIGEYLKN